MAMHSSAERARIFYRDLNGRFPDTRERYTAHRDRVMDLVTSVPAARSICVLGAGNCADIDLARLALAFEQIDLVDLDVEALRRSHERAPAEARGKLTLHAGVDLSGFIEHLDPWGEQFPEAPDLAKQALLAARSIVQRIGKPFDVVLSTCVLSQLPIPFQRAWIMRESSWANLIGAIRAVHLATLAGLTRPGGTGVIAFDVLSSGEVPTLGDLETSDSDALEARVAGEVQRGVWSLHPNPHELARELASPGLSSLVRAPRVTPPWLWNLGDATQLVYAIVFNRS